jgi:peroxiredoxin
MKYQILIPCSLVLLASCNLFNSSKDKFVVKGTISGNPGKMVYLIESAIAAKQAFTVDSSPVDERGHFSLHTGKKEAATYLLRIDINDYPAVAVINDAPEITLDIKFNKEAPQIPESYEVKGSPASSRLKEFITRFGKNEEQLYFFDKRSDSLSHETNKNADIAALQAQRSQVADSLKLFVTRSIDQSGNPALAMFELGNYQQNAVVPGFKLPPYGEEEIRNMINALALKYPGHEGMAAQKNMMDEMAAKAPATWVGRQAVDFSLPDPGGKMISLSSFRGKYLLVDFWASWCSPCRRENPNVVKAFSRFHNKNFAILGVSLDTDKQNWLQAIKDDKLNWTQISELKGWESQPVNIYNFGQVGIPYNILVDPEGKIIGERLQGDALEEKLAAVLK